MIRSISSEFANVLSILPVMSQVHQLPVIVSILLFIIIIFHIVRYIPNIGQSMQVMVQHSHLLIPQLIDYIFIYQQTIVTSVVSGIFSFMSMKTFYKHDKLVNPKIDAPIIMMLLLFLSVDNHTLRCFATRDLVYHFLEIMDLF